MNVFVLIYTSLRILFLKANIYFFILRRTKVQFYNFANFFNHFLCCYNYKCNIFVIKLSTMVQFKCIMGESDLWSGRSLYFSLRKNEGTHIVNLRIKNNFSKLRKLFNSTFLNYKQILSVLLNSCLYLLESVLLGIFFSSIIVYPKKDYYWKLEK